MHVVAGAAGFNVFKHHALSKLIALNPLLRCGSAREVGERLAQGDVFEVPEGLEVEDQRDSRQASRSLCPQFV